MTRDPARYEQEVLAPARQRDNALPADLFARYANPPLVAGAAFDSHVDEVLQHWRRLTHSQKYAKLASALLIADKQLRDELRRAAGEGEDARLDGPRLKWLAQEHRRRAQAAGVTEAGAIAPALACVSPGTVAGPVDGGRWRGHAGG